jgi:serine O-acetyltransferase
MGLINLLKKDFEAKALLYWDRLPIGTDWLRLTLMDGTSAIIFYRLAQVCNSLGLTPLGYVFQFLNKLVNHCVIGLGAQFSGGFVLIHPVGVVINSKVVGGSNIRLESGVVIGDNHGHSPTIGNDVFIGSGAKVIGAVHIGDRVMIGANAVVTKSIAANHIALGVPAKSRSRQ